MLRRNRASSSSLNAYINNSSSSDLTNIIPSTKLVVEDNIESNKGTDNDKAANMNTAAAPSPPRSESMAYAAASPASTLWSKLVYYLRFNTKTFVAVTGLLLIALLLCIDALSRGGGGIVSAAHGGLRFGHHSNEHWGGAVHPGYFFPKDAVIDDHTFHFAAVTDLDKLSAVPDSKKPLYRSTLLPGTLVRDNATNKYSIHFEKYRTLVSQHNEAGRGMELSELTIYKNRLLSFDDRTGDVFEILSTSDGKDSYVVPRFVITEGDGDTDKGMKWEWATIKDNELILGSMGKEYTRADGSVDNTNNLWVAVLNERGELRREDWESKFMFVRKAVGAAPPGYIIMEAILWSDHMKKWVFLPRRISTTMYDEVEDEKMGSNRCVLVDEGFTDATVVEIKMAKLDPLHGFSTFAFVPGTKDRHALAVRSVEENCTGAVEDCKQRSYVMVFDVVTGEVLMDEVKIDMAEKFEGIEFVNIYKTPK